jgi:hypothetical protein
MTDARRDVAGEIDHMMQCSDKMTSGVPVDINRTSHKLVLTKY